MRSKRAAVEVQFNWLFVLIIGAVILVIFTSIILKQKKSSETSQSALLLRNLEAILSGSETTQGTVNVIKVPETRIEFRCNGQSVRYSIGPLSKQADVMSVFTPSILEGNQFISMTLDWSVPYRVTNVVYLTSPKYRYMFVGSDPLIQSLYSFMPNETFNEKFATFSSIKFRGENKARFITIDDGSLVAGKQVPKEFAALSDEDISAMVIRGDEDSGEVDFLTVEDDKFKLVGTRPYLKPETLLGAVISDSPFMYECIMKSVLSKLNVVSSVYVEKTNSIRQIYSSAGHRCADLASTAYSLNALNQITTVSSNPSAQLTTASINTLLSAEEQLRVQNKRAQLQSCATIY